MESFQNGNVKLQRYSTTTEPRSPTSPSTPNGHGGLVLGPASLPTYDECDDVFFDEKLKQNNNDVPEFAPPPRTPGTASAHDDPWAQRKLRTRHCLLVAALIVVVLVVAVGVGLAIILTQKDTSSSPSSQTTSTSPSTSPPPVITYSGNFRLRSPWEGSREQLQDNLSQDFTSIVRNSSLEAYYRSASLQSYRPQEKEVSFALKFSPEVTSIVRLKSRDPVREFIQTKLRELIPERKTNLVIIPDTLHLLEYIPDSTTSTSTISTTTLSSSSSQSTSTTTLSSTSTTTESTTSSTTESTTTTESLPVDCIPLDFAPCQGLGYTHFSYPNLFGSENKDYAVEDFYYLANDSLNSGCTDDPTFFCGFAFPPCSAESIQTLPCLHTCEATIERCASHLPEPLDCVGYPTEQPCLESPFPPATTTPQPDTCSPQTFERCKALGFHVTQYPTWFADNETSSVEEFQKWAMPAITSQCHPQVEFFMCSMFFPKCSEVHGNVTLPCRSFCQDVENHCYNNGDVLNIDCAIFEADHSKCLLPVTTTTAPTTTTTTTTTTGSSTTTPIFSTTPIKHQCLPISIEACRHFGHVNGSVPNTWGSADEATTLGLYYDYVQPVVSTGCAASALFYSCAMLFPSCDDEVYLYPCRSVCQEYNSLCAGKTGFFEQQCDFFQDKDEDPYCLLPPAPPSCSEGEFTCEGAPLCIPTSSVCDRKNDCGDWSDERQCECKADFEFQCAMGLCVRSYKRCDNETDCPDRSDEEGCSNCRNGQFRCDDGTCIMAEWVCDGQYDCPRLDDDDFIEEDEMNCAVCTESQFSCTSGQCIPLDQRCDGTSQCDDHTDENSCIFSGPPTFLNVGGDILPICATGFTASKADSACQRLGYSGSITWKAFDYEFYKFFKVAEDGLAHTILGSGSIVEECGQVVELECSPAECGQRRNYMVDHIVNGMDASPREVPWQVSIQEFGKHFCGGSVIHPYFVLTAAHCVEKYTLNFEYLEVVLGAVEFQKPEAGRRTFTIKRIINHPDYLTFQGNDVALVELAEPVTYSDDIQPLCLSRPGDVFTRGSLCYTSGWGKMDPDSNEMASHLQIVKMSLWDTNKCNSSFAWDGQLQSTEICAGYYAGIKAACRGDSGGPLFCYDNDYRWRLVGVASYVHIGCNKPEKPVVFSDAVRYNDWIANNTACQFHCGNGRCLFDSNMVCNKQDDCGDNSDEIDNCDISANCTFDDQYLCGYRTVWLWKTEAVIANRYPIYDHTLGRYPGKFLLAAFRGKNLHTPRIDLTSPHCLRFRYHMRGEVRQGLTAHVHELSESGKWRKVWHVQNYDGPDRWLLGQFDLGAGNFDIVFMAYDSGVATMDDISLLDGKCQDQGCGEGEFACYTSGLWNCLPEAVRCNTVIDCDDAEDENNCTAPSYVCDFENGLLCGLEQDSYDSTSGEWRLLNTSRAGIDDVTFGDGTGHVLQIITERLLTTDFVYMGHNLYLGGQEHCLAFSYWSTSTVRIEIDFIPEGADELYPVWTLENRQTSGWSKTQASLPAEMRGHLQYTVIGGDLNRSVIHPMVAIDNLTITPGACPTFTCPAGQTQCSTEAYCLDDARFCDRVVDCWEAADEISCNCTEEEFKCPTGPCIPLQRTCDTVPDCPDASDEGSICESLRSVSCDFEGQFMCGYTHNGSLTTDAAYVWSREHNRRPGQGINIGTGPIYDHTFQNESGHWAFANGENGHPFDYVALQSPFFSSAGNDVLVFYYFAYSMFSQFWLTGSLGLLTRNFESGNSVLSWYKEVDGNATWRSACVQLPKGDNLTVSFVSMRGRNRRADLAVDDVQLLQTTCDQFYKESRLRAGATTQNPQPTPPPAPGCPSGQRACRSGLCIDESNFCDTIKDCPDSSDENFCDNNG